MSTHDPSHTPKREPQEEEPGRVSSGSGEFIRQDIVIDEDVAHELRRIRAFQVGLSQQTPRLIWTPVLLAINILVFVAMVISGVSLWSPTPLQVLPWGANHGVLTLNGDVWRLLTCTFLHLGIIHLLVNMYALYILGPIVERVLQPTGYLVLYLLSGIGGSLASVWWQPVVTSAGASGAIFGVFGALMGFALRQKSTLPPSIFVQLRNNGVMILVLNIILGLSVQSIDMAGHLGGLVVGFVVAWLISQPVGIAYSRQRWQLAWFAAVIGTGLAVAVFFLIPREAVKDPLQLLELRQLLRSASSQQQQKALTQFMRAVEKFRKQEKLWIDRYNRIQGQVATRQITQPAFVQQILRDIYPAWSKLDEGFATISLEHLPPAYRQKMTLLLRYIKVRGEHFYTLAKGIESDNAALLRQAQQKSQEIEKIIQALNQP